MHLIFCLPEGLLASWMVAREAKGLNLQGTGRNQGRRVSGLRRTRRNQGVMERVQSRKGNGVGKAGENMVGSC